MHTKGFTEKQQVLGLLAKLDKWYSETSAIIHGQLPGKWVTHTNLREIGYDENVCELGIKRFEEAGDIFNRMLLCTVNQSFWYRFTKDSKKEFLRGLKGKEKDALDLTVA